MGEGMFHPVHVPALRSGQVECIPCKPWDAEKLIKEGCNALVKPADQYPDGRPERIIAATGRILEERPDLVKSFLKGMIRSYWFVRDMPKNFEYIRQLEKRLRYNSADPEERKIKISSAAPVDLEAMPFPIDGRAQRDSRTCWRRRRSLGSLTIMCRPSKMCAPRIWSQGPTRN